MVFGLKQPSHVLETMQISQDFTVFQQIGSAFQHMAMNADQELSIAVQSNFMDKIKQKHMIVGLNPSAQTYSNHHSPQEDVRLTEQTREMVVLLKTFQGELEQNANHVSCRMHDFRCYLLSHLGERDLDMDAVYLRARECVNQAMGDLILLKEQTRNSVGQLTLGESDAARMFELFSALERLFNELTLEVEAKIGLLQATLSKEGSDKTA